MVVTTTGVDVVDAGRFVDVNRSVIIVSVEVLTVEVERSLTIDSIVVMMGRSLIVVDAKVVVVSSKWLCLMLFIYIWREVER